MAVRRGLPAILILCCVSIAILFFNSWRDSTKNHASQVLMPTEKLSHGISISSTTIPLNEGVGTTTVSCATGIWAEGRCTSVHSSRIGIAILPLAVEQIFLLKGGQVVPFVNKTGYQAGPGVAFPLGNCFVYDVLRPGDNQALLSCTTIETGNQRRVFPLDLDTYEIQAEYTGPLPANAQPLASTYGEFGDTPYHNHDVSSKGMYSEIPGDGIYYFTNSNDKQIRYTQDGFLTYTIAKEVEGIRLLHTFEIP